MLGIEKDMLKDVEKSGPWLVKVSDTLALLSMVLMVLLKGSTAGVHGKA